MNIRQRQHVICGNKVPRRAFWFVLSPANEVLLIAKMALPIQKEDYLQVAILVFKMRSVELAAKELRMSEVQVMARLQKFVRYICHPSRFGNLAEMRSSKWNSSGNISCSKHIHCSGLLREAVRRFKIELSSGDTAIWSEPLPVITDLPIPKSVSGSVPDWNVEMDALLGKSSDQSVASILGMKQSDVRKRRLKLSINSFGGGGLDSH